MDTIEAMKAFVAAAEARSFAEAARRLDLAPPVVTRAVQTLEGRVGMRLFNRTTRRVALTEAGERYLSTAMQALEQLDEMESSLRGEASGEVSGTLRLTMPVTVGSRYLVPMLAEFKNLHPRLRLDLDFCDHLVDPISRGFDAAIRVSTALADSTLTARRIGSFPVVLAAAATYLARRGTPDTMESLRGHDVLQVASERGALRIVGRDVGNDEAIRANSAEALRGFAVAGLGLIRAPAFVVADELACGQLVRVLPDVSLGEYVVSAVFPHRTMMPVRLRRLLDHLALGFAALPHEPRRPQGIGIDEHVPLAA